MKEALLRAAKPPRTSLACSGYVLVPRSRPEGYTPDERLTFSSNMLSVEANIDGKLVAVAAIEDASKIYESIGLVVGVSHLVEHRAQ